MNSLNSILIEGALLNKPEVDVYATGEVIFQIASNRFYRADDEYRKEVSLFNIRVISNQLAETCFNHLSKDQGVRVVGRLRNVDGTVEIVAEHVEIKPVLRKVEEVTA